MCEITNECVISVLLDEDTKTCKKVLESIQNTESFN